MTTASYASLQSTVGPTGDGLLKKDQDLSRAPAEVLLSDAIRTLRYELDLSGYERRRHVIDRLRAWLDLEPEQARRIAIAFADCTAELSPAEQAEITATEEDAVMDGLSYAEFQLLAAFVPSLRKLHQSVPAHVATGAFGSSLAAVLAMAAVGSEL